MKLKFKIIIILLVVIASYAALEFGIQSFIIFPSFVALEKDDAKQDIERCVEAIRREVQHLNLFNVDWSAWDDSYKFIEDRNPAFIESNLNYDTFKNPRINLIYFYNMRGELVWGQVFDLTNGEQISLRDFAIKAAPGIQKLLKHDNVKSFIQGVVMTEHGPMLISSRPIVTTSSEGPIRGTIIMGRFLDDAAVKTLNEQTRVDFQIRPLQSSSIPADEKDILSRLGTGSPFLIAEQTKYLLNVYTTIPDLEGAPVLLIKATIPRGITVKGTSAQSFAVFSIFAVGLIVLIVLFCVMQRIISGPIAKLTSHIIAISTSNNLPAPLSMQRSDEVGILAQEFNRMVRQVHSMQTELKKRIAELSDANMLLADKNAGLIRAEEALQVEQNRLAAIVDGIPIATFVIDTDHRVVIWNRACETLTKVSRDSMLGKPVAAGKFYPGEERTTLADLILDMDEKAIKTFYNDKNLLKVASIPEAFEVSESASSSGKQSYIHILAARLRDSSGKVLGAVETIQDVTDREQLQKQLLNAQKMEAIGTLAGGVAHDLNNVLTATISYPELLLLSLPEDNPMRKPIVAIKEAGEKAAAIVNDLLTLARRGVNVSEVLNLNTIITEYCSSPLYEKVRAFNPRVQFQFNLQADLLNCMGSPVHFTKTVMNLISNAAEAISRGGTVAISTENQYLDKPVKGYDKIKEGEYIVLTIEDSGTGIAKEDLAKIFEPFFTKKVMGRNGTGLGLAVVWGTVQDHNGYIEVNSTPGSGTTFKLYFPAARKEIVPKREAVPIGNYSGNREHILVVDDVEAQREIASTILSKLNYHVAAVSSGEEAVAYVKSKSVDLVVLDMIMDPGIDGLETYRRILEIRKKQKVIIASGFSETERVKEAQRLGAGSYIKKPYMLEKLGMTIKTELAKSF